MAAPASLGLLRPGPFAVGELELTLVDRSRATAANGAVAASPERVLETSVWYPARHRSLEWLRAGPPPLARGACPSPLVIYSHGFMSFRHNGAYLATHLASHGYVVAAANFPLTHFGTPGGPQFHDVLHQPEDVSFLIDTLLAWNDAPDNRFAGCIDRGRIGAVGLSLGGMTTTLLAFHPTLRDARVAVAVSIAGPSSLFGERFFATSAVPLLMIAGDIDALVDYADNAKRLQERAPAVTLVTLRAGSHTGFAGLAARFLRWLPNPDSLGCWAIRRQVTGQLEQLGNHSAFIEALGGEAAGIRRVRDAMPCRHTVLPRAMRPGRQQDLTRSAVLAFLQAQFHPTAAGRAEYGRMLVDRLPRENPEIKVRPGRRLLRAD